jgi:adenine/guanine phosphoribosyltransferase-like PRPP-binding protein
MIERSSTCHIDDVIDTSVSTFATIPMVVTIEGGIVNRGCVITKTFLGMIALVEFFDNIIT